MARSSRGTGQFLCRAAGAPQQGRLWETHPRMRSRGLPRHQGLRAVRSRSPRQRGRDGLSHSARSWTRRAADGAFGQFLLHAAGAPQRRCPWKPRPRMRSRGLLRHQGPGRPLPPRVSSCGRSVPRPPSWPEPTAPIAVPKPKTGASAKRPVSQRLLFLRQRDQAQKAHTSR